MQLGELLFCVFCWFLVFSVSRVWSHGRLCVMADSPRPALERILDRCNIDITVPRREFVDRLRLQSTSFLLDVRSYAFSELISVDLAHPRDVLVARKTSASNPLCVKLAEDIWTLVDLLRKLIT